MSKKMSTFKSFGFAFSGLKTAFSQEPNFKIHVFLGAVALTFGALTGLGELEWLLLLFTVILVIIMELINTTLESIVDIVQPKFHKSAKIAKDVSAAAVLVAAINAIIVGVVLFL